MDSQISFTFLLTFFATLIFSSLADYVVDLRLLNYSNYNALMANGKGCGGFFSWNCDTGVKVCLYKLSEPNNCVRKRQSGTIGGNTNVLSKGQLNGILNPVVFRIKSPLSEFGLRMTLFEVNQAEVINTFIYEVKNPSPQKNFEVAKYTTPKVIGTPQPDVTLSFKIRYYCEESFYGPACSKKCFVDPDEEKRAECDVNGNRICKAGYTGQMCFRVAVNACSDYPCKNDGTCLPQLDGSYKCLCDPSFTGSHCNKGIDECSVDPHPCLNGGTCKDGILRFSCICAPGFTGQYCQTSLSACTSNPCRNNAVCTDLPSGQFQCNCPIGFIGTLCADPACSDNSCFNGGTCVPQLGGFRCDCRPGYQGNQCQDYSPCSLNPCQNGGVCNQVSNTDYICTCINGYGGKNCDIINPCVFQPCLNNGRCYMSGNNQYSCACRSEWTGTRCETPVGPCSSNPCQDNGQCTSNGNSYYCNCTQGWTGSICNVQANPCNSYPCQNYGQCIQNGTGFHCICQKGWTGPTCSVVSGPCNPNPCQNNGQCTRNANSFTCNCQPGWTGTDCLQPTGVCYPNPCKNNGKCFQSGSNFSCTCIPRYTGKFCEATAGGGGFICPNKNHPGGLFPDPKNCNKFYQCDYGKAFHKICPKNLYFNRVLMICDWQIESDCIMK